MTKRLVAQWLEQGSHKPLAAGSNPAEPTKFENGVVVQSVETSDLKSLQCGFESHQPYQLKVFAQALFYLLFARI